MFMNANEEKLAENTEPNNGNYPDADLCIRDMSLCCDSLFISLLLV